MKVIMLSIDALMTSDLEVFKKLPNMGKLLKNASVVDRIMSVYPTYTYACHASMISGFYPAVTGVAHNTLSLSDKWMWARSFNKSEIITDVLKRHGYTTAAVVFPVTGGADIDYLVPEVWAESETADTDPVFKQYCSEKGYEIYKRHKSELKWMKTPWMDSFATSCAIDILREGSPDFLMIHLSYMDHQRHVHGPETENIIPALSFIDEQVGRILPFAAGYEWVILGDHGHRRVNQAFSINKALAEMGVHDIRVDSLSFSAQVYSERSRQETYEVLTGLQKRYPGTIEAIHDQNDLAAKRVGGKFSFMLDSADGVVFYQGLDKPVLFEKSGGNHGYAPEKGPFSPLILPVSYPVDSDCCHLTDIAPTVLKLYGIEYSCDGQSLI